MEIFEVVSFEGLKGSPLLGISEANRDESVVCTSRNGGISVYDVPSHRAVLSWVLMSPDCITVPISYIPSCNQYVGVKNNNELIYWDPSVKFVSDFKVLKLPHPVHSLLTTPTSIIVIVYRDGCIELLEYDNGEYVIGNQSCRHKKKATSKFIVRHSIIVTIGDIPYILVIYKVGGVYHASLHSLSLNDSTVKEFGSMPIQDCKSLGEVMSLCSSSATLYLTWSKGCVHSVDLTLLVRHLQLTIRPQPMLGRDDSPTGVECVNDKYIVTLHDRYRLSVYDINYHTLQSSVTIDQPIESLSKCYHGYVFLFSSLGQLIGCSLAITHSNPTLAHALGKGISSIESKVLSDAIVDGKPSLALTNKIESFLSASTNRTEKLALVKSGAYPASMSSSLYMEALQHSDWSMIAVCVDHVQCLPEDTVVSIIESILKLPDDFTISIDDEVILRDQLLWKVLSLPRNDGQLLKPLINMSQTSVIAFFHLLCEYIETCYITTATTNEWSQFEDAIAWFGLVLDSHFTRLILVPSVQSRILEVRECINGQISTIANLSILACTQDIVKLSQRQSSNANWLYKVEHINFKK